MMSLMMTRPPTKACAARVALSTTTYLAGDARSHYYTSAAGRLLHSPHAPKVAWRRRYKGEYYAFVALAKITFSIRLLLPHFNATPPLRVDGSSCLGDSQDWLLGITATKQVSRTL